MRRELIRVPDRDAVAQLARAAQRDDARALDALLSAIRPSFARFFARLTRDVAEDLTQVALIRTVYLLGEMRAERVVQHLTTIARRLMRDECLRQQRDDLQRVAAELAEEVEWPVDLMRQAEYEELVLAVDRAIALALPADLRALAPGVLGDRSLAELGSDTGLDAATIRLRLSRARAILCRELRPFAEW